jgi:branched-subunit amino acid transport protein
MSTSIVLAIIVTSLATFSSRLLGVISSKGIKENSKLFRWFNCLAYSTLAALIARTIFFPVGALSDSSYLSRVIVVTFCLWIFFITKRNFVYPTVISAIIMAMLNIYL